MGRTRRRRVLVALALSVAAIAMPGGTAAADPAGPTDYLTEIVAVDPPVDTIELRVLGGDSFLELQASPGTDVRVTGYQGEPYLWFQPDGTVLENRNSPTTYQNEERFGGDEPDFASADADPDWATVADDGSYAWHDHRAHWMQTIRPAGKSPGDQILEAVVPLVVDGVEVDVTVSSTWQSSPSRLPAIVGLVVGVLLAAGTVVLARRDAMRWPVVLVPAAAAATVLGWIHYTSLPAETGTPPTTWALPATGLAALVIASVLRPAERFWVAAASVLGGVQLLLWTWLERDGFGASILPTSAPDGVHRATVVLAAVAGVTALGLGGRQLARAMVPSAPATS